MVTSVFYIVSFVFAVAMLVLLPKTEKKMNVIVDVMFSYITILNVAALLALLINLIGIPISQISMGGVFSFVGIGLLIVLVLKKRVQLHFLRRADVCAIGLLVILVVVFMLYVFTPYIHANYYNNVDPYNHFLYAQSIIRSGKLTGMFYNSLYNAMFMKLFLDHLPQVWGYKAFILSDIYYIILELIFFYAVISLCYENKKNRKYAALIWSLAYSLSFILFSFLWGFVYWSMAAMLIQYVLVLVRYRKDIKSSRNVWTGVCIGIFAVTMCYIEFAPIIVSMVAVVIIYHLHKDGKISVNGKLTGIAAIIVCGLILLALVGYKYVFRDTGVGFLLALQMGEQQNIGLEVLFFVPWIMYIILNTVRDKKSITDMQLAYVTGIVLQFILTLLSVCHILSTYYLQKSYIILFFLSVMILIEGAEGLSWEKANKIYIAYMGLGAFLVLSYAGDESKTISLQQSTAIQNLNILSTYDFSEGELSDNSKIYLMQYAVEDLQKTNGPTSLIVSGGKGRGTGLWLDATYDNANFIWIEDGMCTEEQMTNLLKESGAKQFIIFYDDLLYIFDLHDYFDSFERVYQNEAGFIGKID